MRLDDPLVRTPVWAETEDAAALMLSARLQHGSAAPIAVAVSGGGDSLAMLFAALNWARCAQRRLVCLTVDHNIASASAAWTRACAERARALGLDHRALAWTQAKPVTGLAASARSARHRLLADAARDLGASVILMGHTADDRLEARLMREQGCNLAEPRAWSPSPAWPEGRGVFILRPLIEIRRAAIRHGLREIGETWLDDAANADEASLRARVRQKIADGGDPGPARDPVPADALLAVATVGWAGDIAVPIAALDGATPATRHCFLSAALLSAAGTTSPPRREAIARLWERLSGAAPMAATLAGARIEGDTASIRIMRDDGALRDRVGPSTAGSAVFDGRFEVEAPPPGARLAAMDGHMTRLCRSEREFIKTAPPAARRALPVFVGEDRVATCPAIPRSDVRRARSLVAERLHAALGGVRRETMIRGVGEIARGVLNKVTSTERSVHEPA